jgi:hypothetical protein
MVRHVQSEIILLTDEELEILAREAGPLSIEAKVLRDLNDGRARDRQIFAFRIGGSYYTGPMPDAEMEATLIKIADADDD